MYSEATGKGAKFLEAPVSGSKVICLFCTPPPSVFSFLPSSGVCFQCSFNFSLLIELPVMRELGLFSRPQLCRYR